MGKDAMIAAYERGETTYAGMVDHYLDSVRAAADLEADRRRDDTPEAEDVDA